MKQVVLILSLLACFPVQAQDPVFRLQQSSLQTGLDMQQDEIVIPRIDDENFELGVFIGGMAVEDFGASTSSGAALKLHIHPRLFLELSQRQANVTDEAYYRNGIHLFGDRRNLTMTVQTAVLGVNLLPGELFWSEDRVFPFSTYLLLGAGETQLGENEDFSSLIGLGMHALLSDWASIHADARVYETESNYLGFNKYAHNFEVSLGASVFF